MSGLVKMIIMALLIWCSSALPAEEFSFRQSGEASWYGPGFQGRTTANGETFDTNEMTAAHRSLPFDSFVRVTNRTNGKSVVVRINDRGPFIEGRIIDLSRAAAEELEILSSGTAPVLVERIPPPPHFAATQKPATRTIQIASFRSRANADELIRRLGESRIFAEIEQAGAYYRVIVPGLTETNLTSIMKKIERLGFQNPLIREE